VGDRFVDDGAGLDIELPDGATIKVRRDDKGRVEAYDSGPSDDQPAPEPGEG
jgi:hypothetical protein